MGRIGLGELVVVLVVVLVVFGATRLPQIGEALGRSIREFQRALKGDKKDDSVEK